MLCWQSLKQTNKKKNKKPPALGQKRTCERSELKHYKGQSTVSCFIGKVNRSYLTMLNYRNPFTAFARLLLLEMLKHIYATLHCKCEKFHFEFGLTKSDMHTFTWTCSLVGVIGEKNFKLQTVAFFFRAGVKKKRCVCGGNVVASSWP